MLPGFAAMESEQIAQVAHWRRYRRGEVVFHQGDPGDSLHVIATGRMKVVFSADSGKEAVLAVLGPGDVFGEMALLDGGVRSATVVALEPVRTAMIGRQDFFGLLRRRPALAESLLRMLAGTVRRANADVGDLIFLDLHARVAKRLLELSDEHGWQTPGGVAIQLRLTQEDLAAMTGATRASVNKVLGTYESQGFIARRGRQIFLLDTVSLRRRAAAN